MEIMCPQEQKVIYHLKKNQVMKVMETSRDRVMLNNLQKVEKESLKTPLGKKKGISENRQKMYSDVNNKRTPEDATS
jgi:hypothetical protein